MGKNNTLKKASRKELLEILILQNKKIDELTSELEKKNNENNDQNLKILSSGTLAEASLKLNNIFTDADNAAKYYIDSLKKLEQIEKEKIKKLDIEIQKYQNKLKKKQVRGLKNEKDNQNKNKKQAQGRKTKKDK